MIFPVCLALAGLSAGAESIPGNKPDFSQIESGFARIPDSIQTSVYWYWINDNISGEGVVKDLHSMKKAGINRAFIGNIGMSGEYTPYGKVKIFSDEWWEILHTALKTATQLDIEIGIFNSPGWSQSGGPWVKPEEAMRYLSSSTTRVRGPAMFSQKLEKPTDFFQDVKLIAYPVPKDEQLILNNQSGIITSVPEVAGLSDICDGDIRTGIVFPAEQEFKINFEADEAFTARSLSIHTLEVPIMATALFQFATTSGEYHTLSEFQINRSNPLLVVGFEPYAPVVLSFPASTSKSFRLIIKNASPNSGLAEVVLAASPRVEQYAEKTLAKMYQTPLPYWKEYQWPSQAPVDDKSTVIDGTKVIDITEFMAADGTLNWLVPQGEWVILRTGMTPTGVVNEPASPEATGLEVDKMSREHVEKHFYSHMGEILKRIPEADRKSFKVVVQDSYEKGGQNMTDDFLVEFRQKYGYDPVPYLPVYKGMVVNSQLESDRFLWDMRRMVADKVAYDYVGGLRDVSHKHGLTTWLENYGHWGFPGEFLQYGGQSDEVGGEFWSEGELGNIENRAASSCAHIYGKTKVSAESFTCGGKAYSRYPATLKPRGDRFFTEGINNTLLHVFIQQPDEREPGVNAGFGNEFNRHNTWFDCIDVFIDYLKRTNFMLQQGNYVADAAYFIGEDVPKMTGICDPALPQGYSFDYINAEVIQTRMSVKDGNIVLPDGMAYRILVLPELETMRPELLQKIKDLVHEGAVVLGPAPMYSPSLQNYPAADRLVKKLVKELWGKVDGVKVKSAKVGKGMILSGMEMQEAFDLIGVIPDCRFGSEDPALFIHRSLPGGEVYFVSNQSDKTIAINPEFRVTGKCPELWMATTGALRDLPAFVQNSATTSVPLKLEAYESQFIVFREKARKPETNDLLANFPEGKILAELTGPWEVSFDTARRGPVRPVIFKKLIDWTLSDKDSIRYFSGTAVYKMNFQIPEPSSGQKVILQLGKLTAMARVKLNGIEAGAVWTAPWQVDISNAVKPGTNALEISVVNNWMNRLIGDQGIPVDQRRTWSPDLSYTSDSPLQASGLFGPVEVLSIEY